MKAILTESQFRRIIWEQVQPAGSDSVEKIYQQVVKASKDWGTDPDAIADAISRLGNYKDVKDFMSRFKDKKSGYSTFNEMVNGEYDYLNLLDIKKLERALEEWGEVEYAQHQSGKWTKKTFKSNSFKFTLPVEGFEGRQKCRSKYKKILPEAIKWWEKWLDNSITQEKFMKNHGLNASKVSAIFAEYKNALKRAYIYPYYEKGGHMAYVWEPKPGRIWVNCWYKREEKDALLDLIHELQHLLHGVHHLNPDEQIGELFVGSETTKNIPTDFEKYWEEKDFYGAWLKDIDGEIKNGKPSADVDWYYNDIDAKYKTPELGSIEKWRKTIAKMSRELKEHPLLLSRILRDWFEDATEAKPDDPGYRCRENEKMSNIFSLRKTFNMSPGDKLTTQMLKPYILKSKYDDDIAWLIFCWALNGFVDLKIFTAEFNQLAAKVDAEANGQPKRA